MACSMFAANREDYDRWAQKGNRGWGYEDVLPLFKRSESHEFGESEYFTAAKADFQSHSYAPKAR